MKAQRSDSLWPLSFDQESGDTGVGLLPDKFSNHRITHGTIKKASRRRERNKNGKKPGAARLCHFLSAEKVRPGVALRPEYYSNESLAQRQSLATFF